MRRGETVEVSSPSSGLDAGPRLRERPLGRCHTLDSGGETTEQQPEPANTTENTPQESNETGVTHTPRTSPHPQPDASETHSADDTETPPSSINTPSHADNPPTTQTSADHFASHEPGSQSLRPLNGQSTDERTGNEAPQSETPADLQPTAGADGGDQGDTG